MHRCDALLSSTENAPDSLYWPGQPAKADRHLIVGLGTSHTSVKHEENLQHLLANCSLSLPCSICFSAIYDTSVIQIP